MNINDEARAYVSEILGRRKSLSAVERDIVRQLLGTPAIKSRFPELSVDRLCAIADEIVAERATGQRPDVKWRRSG